MTLRLREHDTSLISMKALARRCRSNLDMLLEKYHDDSFHTSIAIKKSDSLLHHTVRARAESEIFSFDLSLSRPRK